EESADNDGTGLSVRSGPQGIARGPRRYRGTGMRTVVAFAALLLSVGCHGMCPRPLCWPEGSAGVPCGESREAPADCPAPCPPEGRPAPPCPPAVKCPPPAVECKPAPEVRVTAPAPRVEVNMAAPAAAAVAVPAAPAAVPVMVPQALAQAPAQ